MKEKYSKQIIDRAVDLWCRKLQAPSFDNGDDSLHGAFAMGLSMMNSQTEKAKLSDFDELVEGFRTELTARINQVLENDGYVYLDVDYGPSGLLAEAAEAAGIPQSQFSIKSTVYLYEDHVASSFGYGAEHEHHYPLSDDRWLVTKLQGSDMDKIISEVESGNDLGLMIEAA